MSDSGRKVDIVAAAIEEAISTGRWPVGSKLPPETALVEELGVARNTMREAVRALAHAGVLSVRHGGGVYVMAASPVEGLLGRRLARGDVLDVLSLRRGLEVEAARLAAQRHTPKISRGYMQPGMPTPVTSAASLSKPAWPCTFRSSRRPTIPH